MTNRTHTGPTLPTLSPESLAALKLPIYSDGTGRILDAEGGLIAEIWFSTRANGFQEMTDFMAALLNAALAAPSAAGQAGEQ